MVDIDTAKWFYDTFTLLWKPTSVPVREDTVNDNFNNVNPTKNVKILLVRNSKLNKSN